MNELFVTYSKSDCYSTEAMYWYHTKIELKERVRQLEQELEEARNKMNEAEQNQIEAEIKLSEYFSNQEEY